MARDGLQKGAFVLSRNTINWSSPVEYSDNFRKSDANAIRCSTCKRFKACTSGTCRGWCDGVRRVERMDGWSPPWCPRKAGR